MELVKAYPLNVLSEILPMSKLIREFQFSLRVVNHPATFRERRGPDKPTGSCRSLTGSSSNCGNLDDD